MNRRIVICGTGIAGISTAYYLSQLSDKSEVTLIDQYQPLSFTSSKSGENFRDYWPHYSMESLANHSIDLMKHLNDQYSKDAFRMEFSGYHFISHNANLLIFKDENSQVFLNQNEVILDKKNIHKKYSYLDKKIAKSVFIKNAGNIDSITMANLMLKESKKRGVKFIQGTIINLKSTSLGFEIILEDNTTFCSDQIVLSVGPFLNQVLGKIYLKLPIWNTLQRKFIIPDPLHIIPKKCHLPYIQIHKN